MNVNYSDLIAKPFYDAFHDIKEHKYTHYWFRGGRGSTKSSFISLEIIKNLMKEEGTHAVAFRRVGDTLRDSVYAQLRWAIDALGVSHLWQVKISPLQLIYTPNGNMIMFRGVDDPQKAKSIKAKNGYFAYIWFEELAEFNGLDDINSIIQSVMRGGEKFWVFYSYNPPERINSWVNVEATIPRADRKVYHSTYLDVPREWLGDAFIVEAEHMRDTRPQKYEWQYLGSPTGTGGEIFRNVKALDMTDGFIETFDNVKAGLDWGYSIDPLAYVEYHKDTTRKTLYIYHEFYGLQVTNEKIARHILSRGLVNTVIADSADPKSIADVRSYGVRIRGAVKNRNSRERTMKHLTDDIETIYIDPKRCPNTYRELTNYELERDRHGNFKSDYPDKDDHTIDALRYGEDDINYSDVKGRRGNIY